MLSVNCSPLWLEVERTLPRFLSQYDIDPFSPTLGLGDRFHWSWKLIDFANGTFQGGVNGLARLVTGRALPDYISEEEALFYIDRIIRGTKRAMRGDGSLEEAFPYEGSYCVTALVAYDILTAIELLRDKLAPQALHAHLELIRPAIGFLKRSDESHAEITNHLATATAALFKWNYLTGENDNIKFDQLLGRILSFQSPEGWFSEYGGADPGYQTLCVHYLADLYRMTKLPALKQALLTSMEFLQYFAHPDGSFGGFYGSRNTRVYYPGGIAFCGQYSPAARSLTQFMASSIARKNTVVLSAIDNQNLIPLFNSYVWAAGGYKPEGEQGGLPCLLAARFVKHFPQAGLLIYNDRERYTVVAAKKGGVVAHFDKEKHTALWNCGAVATDAEGRYYSAQADSEQSSVDTDKPAVVVQAGLYPVEHKLPDAFRFILLRLANITVMRNGALREWVKKLLVRYLIKTKKKPVAKVERRIVWDNQGEVMIDDCLADSKVSGLTLQKGNFTYKVFHMASSWYWQKGGALSSPPYGPEAGPNPTPDPEE